MRAQESLVVAWRLEGRALQVFWFVACLLLLAEESVVADLLLHEGLVVECAERDFLVEERGQSGSCARRSVRSAESARVESSKVPLETVEDLRKRSRAFERIFEGEGDFQGVYWRALTRI
ncbi:hypothetical protein KSP39_PZI022805 [Platanthera zijinensis]|uniref:Uncharacterized protein n=1 Tax=Platanthera zijinensis TaxID=2320716 RepID=A0AAP0FUW7_9ASPA